MSDANLKLSTPPLAPRASGIYRRLFGYLRPYRGRFILAMLAMTVYGATDAAIPYILKRVLDDIFGAKNEAMLWQLVAVIIIFAVIRGGFGFLERYLIATVGLNIVRDLRSAINRHLLNLSASYFSDQRTGGLISRMTNDTLLVRTALTDAAGAFLRDSVRVIALLSMAIYLDPMLGLIVAVGFPLGLYPVLKFGRKVRRYSRIGQDRFGGLTSLLQEMVLGHRVVQAFTQEQLEQDRFQEENESVTDMLRRAEKYGAMSGPTNELFASCAIAAVILYGGFSVLSGVRTQGDFIAFITAMLLLYEPLKKLGRMNTTVQAGLAAADRIFEVLDAKPAVEDCPEPREIDFSRPEIEYRNVSFEYRPSVVSKDSDTVQDEPQRALHNISLQIPAGQTLALVGMSGGGKSTLVNLLPRFYDPTAGSILINGIDLRELSLAQLRQSIAIVSQHTFLFHETVAYNIAYGKSGATEAEIAEAAKAAHAHEFIERLPEGYGTMVGEQGFRLSGGERARIAIARALLKDAPILILDEATASLDSESEVLVQQAIDRLMSSRTVLVIAHRLSTVRRANRIAVLSHGQVMELGTHDELISQGGEYAKLYRLQFRDQRGLESEHLGEHAKLQAV